METPQTEGSPAAPGMPLSARLMNIFVAPGEVFDDVKRSAPQASNWIVPAVLMIVASLVSVMIVFSQPAVIQNLKNAEDAQEVRLQKRVTDGKMTQQIADQQKQVLKLIMSPSIAKALGIVSAVIGTAVYIFLVGLIAWVLAKTAFGAPVAYGKMLEVVGLPLMIWVLDAFVMMLLAVIYSTPGITLGPAMFVSGFDITKPENQVLASMDVLILWMIAVLSMGLSRITGAAFYKPALWLYGLWLIPKVLAFALGRLQQG